MSWFNSLARWIEQRGGARDIVQLQPDGSKPLYLKRFYILKTPVMEIMIHRFFLSDADALHDHPWESCSIILETGYYEHVLVNGTPQKFFRKPGYVGGRLATALHRVELLPGTEGSVWTLFITFVRRRQWGFLTPEGWKDAPTYHKEQGTEALQTDHNQFKGWLFPVRRDPSSRHSAPQD